MRDVPTFAAVGRCCPLGRSVLWVPLSGTLGHGMRTTVPYLSKTAWIVMACGCAALASIL
jgi:hypothetical protein